MNITPRRLLPLLLLLLAGCGTQTIIARHELDAGAPDMNRESCVAYLKTLMTKGVNLEKSGFTYARMGGAHEADIQPDAFTLTYHPYLSIVSQATTEKKTRCAYKDLGELRVQEYGASRAPAFRYEVVLGDACGGLSLWGSSKEIMIPLAHTLLLLKGYEGGAPQASPEPAPQQL